MSETRTGPRTLAELAGVAADQFSDHVAARYKRDGEWREQTFEQARTRIEELALGLVATGIAPGDRVAIVSNTRVEWTLVSLAVSAAGAVVVPGLSDECGVGMRVGARRLGHATGGLRGRAAGGEDRAGPPRSCRRLSTCS